MIILKNGRVNNIISSPLIFSPIYWITVFLLYVYRVLKKKRNPDSKSCMSKANKVIIISQTSQYLYTFRSLMVKFSSEINIQCRSSGFLKIYYNFFA